MIYHIYIYMYIIYICILYIYTHTRTHTHTQFGPKVLGLIFLEIKNTEEDTYFFSIQNKLHWHTYRLLCGRTVFEKLLKIPLFGPSLIRQLWLLGSQQHPQSGVLLASFSTWGTGNSLAEVNLESTGGDEGL